jgi:hypothetical protein
MRHDSRIEGYWWASVPLYSHVTYFSIRQDNRIVVLAALERDPDNLVVEMTDFATPSTLA